MFRARSLLPLSACRGSSCEVLAFIGPWLFAFRSLLFARFSRSALSRSVCCPDNTEEEISALVSEVLCCSGSNPPGSHAHRRIVGKGARELRSSAMAGASLARFRRCLRSRRTYWLRGCRCRMASCTAAVREDECMSATLPLAWCLCCFRLSSTSLSLPRSSDHSQHPFGQKGE